MRSQTITHPYWKRSFIGKAINGFLTYQMASWLSLITPEKVDITLYEELKEQFKDYEEYKKQKEKNYVL